jgi:hypothetical protein
MSSLRPRALALVVLVGVLALTGVARVPAGPVAKATAADGRLTNLAHLDFLQDDVTPPQQARHTTYRLAQEPSLGVLWTYADRRAGGEYERIGGGTRDPETNTWSQGAFNADDITRAAVVYLRHWRQFGDGHSRERAYQLLRAVTYLQTESGPNAGNVVLWMQPDGTLNPSAEPVELPDPSDSGPSYWLARTVWALGEGYAAFAGEDPRFAAFLEDRLALSVDALERQALSRYDRWEVSDGRRVPAWLVVDGADASAEAVLGLTRYVQAAPASTEPRRRAAVALGRLAEGIAAMSAGDIRDWPYGAVLPWTHSGSIWHAWASQMPSALAHAAGVLGRPMLLRAAVRDSGTFTPYLLTSTGPANGLLPGPSDRTQIAYGVDSRLQSLLSVAEQARAPGFGDLAAITAAWYFGANPAGEAMYDPATGRTFDGINGDGVVNRNSGAESTIHGLLSMLALDARPSLAQAARSTPTPAEQDGVDVVEAESATTTGQARVVTPDPAWTGESLWSDSALELGPGAATARWEVAAARRPRIVAPIVHATQDRDAPELGFASGSRSLGRVATGGAGAQGVSEAPGALLPRTLPRLLPPGASELRALVRAPVSSAARLDALVLRGLVTRLVLHGRDGGTALLQNADRRRQVAQVDLPGGGAATVRSYDAAGRLQASTTSTGPVVDAAVAPGGFTVVTR